MDLKRGALVTVVGSGDYGKPRPAVVVQGDGITQAGSDSVIVALVTGTRRDAPLLRLDLEPSATNGLKKPSQVMVDKLMTLPRDKVGPVIGHLAAQELLTLNRMLAFAMGLA